MTPLVFRSYWAGPVWVSKAHTIPSGHQFPQTLITLKHPGKAMSASHFQPSGPFLYTGPWLTGPIGPLSPPDKVFARALETGNYLGSSLGI